MMNRGCLIKVIAKEIYPSTTIPLFDENKARYVTNNITVLSIRCNGEEIDKVKDEFDPRILFKSGCNYNGRFIVYKDIVVAKHSYDIPVRKFMGLYTGSWFHHHPNGALSSRATYKNGNCIGTCIFYDENQEIIGIEQYHDNGTKKSEGEMKNNNQVGIWKYWDDSGKIIETINYGGNEPEAKRMKYI